MRVNRTDIFECIKKAVDNIDEEFTLKDITLIVKNKFDLPDTTTTENTVRHQLNKLNLSKTIIPKTNTRVYKK